MREIQEEQKARLFVADVDRVNRKESGGKEGCGGGELLKQKNKTKTKRRNLCIVQSTIPDMSILFKRQNGDRHSALLASTFRSLRVCGARCKSVRVCVTACASACLFPRVCVF